MTKLIKVHQAVVDIVLYPFRHSGTKYLPETTRSIHGMCCRERPVVQEGQRYSVLDTVYLCMIAECNNFMYYHTKP